ncbi:hypothetical protein [Aurantivibrio infirmus]
MIPATKNQQFSKIVIQSIVDYFYPLLILPRTILDIHTLSKNVEKSIEASEGLKNKIETRREQIKRKSEKAVEQQKVKAKAAKNRSNALQQRSTHLTQKANQPLDPLPIEGIVDLSDDEIDLKVKFEEVDIQSEVDFKVAANSK